VKFFLKNMQLTLEQILVQPGQQLLIKDISWQQFETILDELGESRASRVSYSNGLLEIMVPLPEHEKAKSLISDMVKILLEELQLDNECFGSTTFRNEQMSQAVEPDDCFYIQNYRAVLGKDKLDLTIDPPPDLVIEIDITSRTQFENYQLLGVSELWRYTRRGLQIYVLREGSYSESNFSSTFPNFLSLIEVINQYIQQSKDQGRSATLRAFRAWVREQL
jgi:Uma2 family endonuclease